VDGCGRVIENEVVKEIEKVVVQDVVMPVEKIVVQDRMVEVQKVGARCSLLADKSCCAQGPAGDETSRMSDMISDLVCHVIDWESVQAPAC
jgi:hypothetical protein